MPASLAFTGRVNHDAFDTFLWVFVKLIMTPPAAGLDSLPNSYLGDAIRIKFLLMLQIAAQNAPYFGGVRLHSNSASWLIADPGQTTFALQIGVIVPMGRLEAPSLNQKEPGDATFGARDRASAEPRGAA